MLLFVRTGCVSLVERPEDKGAGTLTVVGADFESLDTMREDIYILHNYKLSAIDIIESVDGSEYTMVLSRGEIKRYVDAVIESIDYDNLEDQVIALRKVSQGNPSGWAKVMYGIRGLINEVCAVRS